MVESVIEVIKYVLPVVVVLAGMYFMLRAFFNREERMRNYELRKEDLQESRKIVLPLRLQAHERLVLFLERIHPNSILHRARQQGMSANDLQLALIRSIREEYEFNLSQQLYVSKESWIITTTVKDEMLKLINLIGAKMPEDASSMDLSKAILDYFINSDKDVPTDTAIAFIKEDVKQLF